MSNKQSSSLNKKFLIFCIFVYTTITMTTIIIDKDLNFSKTHFRNIEELQMEILLMNERSSAIYVIIPPPTILFFVVLNYLISRFCIPNKQGTNDR